MSRMADRILQGELYYPRWVTGGGLVKIKPTNVDAYIGNKLRQAQIIDASNVADFYYGESKQSDSHLHRDYPNVAPPFPLFWIEMRCPRFTPGGSPDKSAVRRPFAFGCLVEAWHGETAREKLQEATLFSPPEGTAELMESFALTIKLSLEEKERRYGSSALWEHLTPDEKPYFILARMYRDAAQREQVLTNFPDDGWTCVVTMLVEEQKGLVFGPLGCCVLAVGSSGTPLYLTRPSLHFGQAPECQMLSFEDLHVIEEAMNPLLLAISFLHCRNVEMKQHAPDGPRKKRYLACHGIEPVRFWTLEIQAMQEVLRREGGMGVGTGLQHALHICRGHFRTYQDRGLFGKYKGTFWVPMHLRGTTEEGVVRKDYRIMGPTRQ